jgi:hypothetical protein
LKGENTVACRRAAVLLGEIGPAAQAAVPALRSLMDGEDALMRQLAVGALRKIDPKAP